MLEPGTLSKESGSATLVRPNHKKDNAADTLICNADSTCSRTCRFAAPFYAPQSHTCSVWVCRSLALLSEVISAVM
jgi:hypothetical protein